MRSFKVRLCCGRVLKWYNISFMHTCASVHGLFEAQTWWCKKFPIATCDTNNLKLRLVACLSTTVVVEKQQIFRTNRGLCGCVLLVLILYCSELYFVCGCAHARTWDILRKVFWLFWEERNHSVPKIPLVCRAVCCLEWLAVLSRAALLHWTFVPASS